MLPQLRELEHRFADEIAVVGVHSGKYHAERETQRIRDASLRLGNTHPVVNDRQFRVWRSYAVGAWPTLVVVDARGYVAGSHAGEFTADQLAPALQQVIADAGRDGSLHRAPHSAEPDAPTFPPGRLRFPAGIALAGDRIAIADSGHDRVLVGRLEPDGLTARIERVVGGPGAGFRDGDAPLFRFPQGVALVGDVLYVADAGNHAIRAVPLAGDAVRTVAGTGQQLRTRADAERGALSSPWDIAPHGGQLFIAMAGIHQLWRLDPLTGRAASHVGSFREDIADGAGSAAALAQPMGIAAAGERLYFVDAESSAVRWADAGAAARVETIVGTGLFDFGDRDGVGDAVRLQHPQGIAVHASGRLLVADSYNDALKWVDPATRRAEHWVRGLHEPSAVACGERHAYVADTNAHRVVAVAYGSGAVEEVALGGAA